MARAAHQPSGQVKWGRAAAQVSIALALLMALSGAAAFARHDSKPMRTVEGRVLSIERIPGEGGMEVLSARLEIVGAPDQALELLLAPETVCEQIGFHVEQGDRLRARIFVSSDGPVAVQKVQNLTQGTMVRMRTLHSTPLWTMTGAWRGGKTRNAVGPHQSAPGNGKGHEQ